MKPGFADLSMLRRHGIAVYLLAAVLTAGLCVFAPPTEADGSFGWVFAASVVATNLVYAVRCALPSAKVTRRELSLMGFVGVLQIGGLQWLAGGHGKPYEELLLLSVFASSSVHSRRAMVPYLLLVTAVSAAPFIYDGWNAAQAGGATVYLLLLCGVALITKRFVSEMATRQRGLRDAGRRAERIARSDTLTGLGNRRAFDETLEQEVARSRRTHTPLSLIVADLDRFKDVNDEFGHLVGDELLQQVAAALESAMRKSDRVFRWGGDEFAVLLPDTGHAAARHLEGRLKAAVQGGCLRPEGEALTVSAGAAELLEGMTAQELIEAADLAMMTDKARLGVRARDRV